MPGGTGDEAITVRMYRGILGDCFLLTHSHGDDRFHALIDCGVLQCIGKSRPLTKASLETVMPNVVQDLLATTGKRLDLVIATHEHYDHLSGFILEHETFAKFEIGAVWVAWTESQTDTEANDIRAKGKKALSVLKAVVDEPVKGLDAAAQGQRETVEALLQFYDPEIEPWTPEDAFAAAKPPRPYDPAKQAPRSCANAITWLRHRAGEANVKYLEPGQVIAFGLNNRLKATVLGPPRTGHRLLQLDPSTGASREVYLAKTDDIATLETILRSRAFGLAGRRPAGAPPGGAAQNPFSSRFDRSAKQLGKAAVVQSYFDEGAQARRIDGEWLGAAEALALKIDGDVNNTSLVLAIEAPGPARHVLLFPADAQVGNWLSWHDQRYPSPEKDAPPGTVTESAQDILSRVILYKVGHHASHNATAREKGLEMMTSPNLTAMIPVVEAVAREQTTRTNTDGWAMPYHDLYGPLLEKTRKRTLRGDGDPVVETKAFQDAGGLFEAPVYAKAKAGQPPLWVELRLPLDTA